MTESIGQRFRRMRQARGLTQRDVARWMRLGVGAIASFEHDLRWRHPDKLYWLERYWAFADCRSMLIGGDRRLARFPKAA